MFNYATYLDPHTGNLTSILQQQQTTQLKPFVLRTFSSCSIEQAMYMHILTLTQVIDSVVK